MFCVLGEPCVTVYLYQIPITMYRSLDIYVILQVYFIKRTRMATVGMHIILNLQTKPLSALQACSPSYPFL